MTDPLSVTAGAAGFISLAITVCQGLITYYKAWDGWEDDVRGAVQDVEDILKFLDLLNVRIVKLSVDQADIVGQAHTAKERIVAAVKKLETIRDKCKAIPAENGESQRFRNLSRRSLYPFKQRTLRELQDAVRQARAGLTDLLQLLQM
jgi:ankyrin repeat domain-containing protein 50